MNLQNKTILVTGGAGFIGSHMVDALINEGAKVSIIDNLSTGRYENLNNKANFYKVNIADPAIDTIYKKIYPDIIYHFASNVLVPVSVKNPLADMDSIIGSVRLLVNARDYHCEKFIFASSGFIYGNNLNLPLKETEPVTTVSPYAIAKYTIENYMKFFYETYKVPYVILRYPGVYGPRQTTGAMADYIRKLSAGLQAEIWGDGMKTRDYICVTDVVEVNLKVLDLPTTYENPIFNVGTGKETTLNELYQIIAKLLQKKALPIYLPDRDGEQIRYALDCTKIKQALGWKYRVELLEGLKKRIES